MRIRGGMAKSNPYRIIRPRSTPKRPATAKGPGVGGTAWWVTTRPAAKATPRVTTERPVWRAKALARGERITKPESQKMGMETTYPVEARSEEHTSELQSRENLVCRLLLEKK